MFIFAENKFIMTATIIRIGNSKGVIIPASLLKKAALSERDNVKFTFKDNAIVMEKEDIFTGPFTGPFAALKAPDDVWGGPDTDAAEVAAELRKYRRNKKIIEW